MEIAPFYDIIVTIIRTCASNTCEHTFLQPHYSAAMHVAVHILRRYHRRFTTNEIYEHLYIFHMVYVFILRLRDFPIIIIIIPINNFIYIKRRKLRSSCFLGLSLSLLLEHEI